MPNELKPSLWKTCRVLANPIRLDILRTLVQKGTRTVQELADDLHLSAPTASLYLKHLQARGLCRATRQGPFVYYSAKSDPLVSQSRPLLTALSARFSEGATNGAIVNDLTAFTHPRRIAIVALALKSKKPIHPLDLFSRNRISVKAGYRHLEKLSSRCVMAPGDDGRYAVLPPRNSLAKALLNLCE